MTTQAQDENLLTVKDLNVDFRSGNQKVHAVGPVSFELAKGETLALVGESGSGKSVTALSILRLLPQSLTSGTVTFHGQNLTQASEAALRKVRGDRISMIFQEPMTSLNPLHTIEKQVNEVLILHKNLTKSAARERTLELLNLVGLSNPERRLGAYPHELSGGQRQRVMIAMALANEPELLIADEPTTALDVTIQAQILDLLLDLQKRFGMALLLITHDFGVVRKMAKHVCVMNKGEIVERGETAKIFDNPQHSYTRALIAAEPKGIAAPPDKDAATIVKTDDLKVHFPIKAGLMRRTVDHVRAVDGVSLQVRAGQTLGVVGESGSGKTTLGLAILRLIGAKGPVVYQGSNIRALPAKQLRHLRQELQIVFQDPFGSLSPRMSVGDIVAEGLKVHHPALGLPERDDRICEILQEVGLDPASRHRFPHEFSGGQRQRISIARAMILRPKFLVLDEPTSALDMSVQAQIVELLKTMQSRHDLAYMFISHDLKVVRALANEVLVMKDGQVVEFGDVQQIFDSPRENYTRSLISAAFDMQISSTLNHSL